MTNTFPCRWLPSSTLLLASSLSSLAWASSSSQLALSADGRVLATANIDSDSVSFIDTQGRKKIHEVSVGERPECVAFAGATLDALVTLYKEDAVAVVDSGAGKLKRKIPVGDEPYGIVASGDGRRAWVSLDYPGEVVEVDLAEGAVKRTFSIGKFARGLALSSDEKRLYVTEFYSAALAVVDLERGAIVERLEGNSSTDNLSRHVSLHPTRPKAYLAHLRSRVTQAHGEGSIFPFVTVVNTEPEEDRRRSPIAMDTFNGVTPVSNPWETAVSPDGKRLYSVYSGTNDLQVCDILDDNYRELSRRALQKVGSHPRAVLVSPDSRTVLVYDTLDFQVRLIDSETLETRALIPCSTPAKSAAWVRGKLLFNSALEPMVGRRWIACSSCHPDGQADARTWQNPEGLRNSTAFIAMKETHPIHWSADRDEVQDFEHTIRGLLMQGRGLIKGAVQPELGPPNAGSSADLDALAEYCNSFHATLSPHAAGPGKLTESANRGKAIFFREDAGCARCHSGPYYTDSSLASRPFNLHDVGTGEDDPSEKMGKRYDTPTLIGIYRTAPYLHHGKAVTLKEVLVDYNKSDRHGRTSHLSPAEIDDLVEFLKSLPYEAETTAKVRWF
jgi:YVTN family beta-propeller protein